MVLIKFFSRRGESPDVHTIWHSKINESLTLTTRALHIYEQPLRGAKNRTWRLARMSPSNNIFNGSWTFLCCVQIVEYIQSTSSAKQRLLRDRDCIEARVRPSGCAAKTQSECLLILFYSKSEFYFFYDKFVNKFAHPSHVIRFEWYNFKTKRDRELNFLNSSDRYLPKTTLETALSIIRKFFKVVLINLWLFLICLPDKQIKYCGNESKTEGKLINYNSWHLWPDWDKERKESRDWEFLRPMFIFPFVLR